MHSLIELAPYGKNGEMQMVVETPRGSTSNSSTSQNCALSRSPVPSL